MTIDPNQLYVPTPYPLMLYATADQAIIVHSAAEEADARERGFTDFKAIDTTKDGLDLRTREELIDIALDLIRANLARTDIPDVIDGIRNLREAEADRLAKLAEDEALAKAAAEAGDPEAENSTLDNSSAEVTEDGLKVMDAEALRNLVAERIGRRPHPATSPEKLLAMATAVLNPLPAEAE